MTSPIPRTSSESPAPTRINTHQIEPHLAKSGQIWTNLNTNRANSQPTAAFPPRQARISPLRAQIRIGNEKLGGIDAVRYHRS